MFSKTMKCFKYTFCILFPPIKDIFLDLYISLANITNIRLHDSGPTLQLSDTTKTRSNLNGN